MNTKTDQELVRAYALEKSEGAFAELVRRHVHLVYSVALRLVVDPHLAEDVTQGTFIALAQNAGKLANREVLSSWLHLTARNLAAKLVRSEERRRAREREAVAMETESAEPEQVWSRIAPHLDEALGGLSEQDRDALMLRFFEQKSARDMARVLGISDDAAQKRVSRAVERLRDLLAKRGLAVGASALVICLSTHAVQAAPASLAATLSTAALAGAAATPAAATATLGKAVAMTALQKTLLAATLAVVTGAGVYEGGQVVRLQREVQALQQQQSPLAEAWQRLRRERDEATNRLAALAKDHGRWTADENELLKLRGEVAVLRPDSEQLKALRGLQSTDQQAATMVEWLDRVQHLKERLAQSPEAFIPEMASLTEGDWLLATDKEHRKELSSAEDYRKAFSFLRLQAEGPYLGRIRDAVVEFTKANGGKWPTDLAQVQPYLKTPMEEAILQRYEIVAADTLLMPNPMSGWVVTQKAPVDVDYDLRWMYGSDGFSALRYKDAENLRILTPAIQAYLAANNGQLPENVDLAKLGPYVRTAEEQAALASAAAEYEWASVERRADTLKLIKSLKPK